jgi:hypothetical protein
MLNGIQKAHQLHWTGASAVIIIEIPFYKGDQRRKVRRRVVHLRAHQQ